ncbi:glycosyltransferase family 4 protein [Sulfobacillus sp. hq2]|uniref:glycosyltransferase family 4 protein n=1 Tax=Sulfobacillus TaxID=28033 RepID=UPI000CD0D0AD|nr:glycosyltransferase family 4 protein [Sulfobacillus sp. hq2]POB09374.1 hypothetical protein CO251_14090 [Sulfobacillus sp. hq2]
MKILHWIGTSNLPQNPSTSAVSGVVKAALELALAERELGNDVTVGAAGQENWQVKWQDIQLVSLKYTRWAKFTMRNNSYDFRQHLPLARYLITNDYDVLHAHLYYYMKFLRARSKVLHFHADPLNEDSLLGPSEWKIIARHGDGGVAVSRYIASRIKEGMGGILWPLITVPNGVRPLTYCDADEGRPYTFRQRIGVSVDAFIFLFAGAFSEAKGVHILAQSFLRLVEELPSIHLVLAGGAELWDGALGKVLPDSYEISIRTLLRNAEKMGRVHYLGPVNADLMQFVYNESNVLVVPSIWNEAFSLVILESLSAGKPVIASRVGGIPEIIDSHTGILVKSNDVDELAAAMRKIVLDQTLYEEMRRHCRRKAEMFTWRSAADELIRFYHNLLDKS